MMRNLKILFASVLFSSAMMAFTTPAFAIPVDGDYTISSTVLSGSFTINAGALSAWSFTTIPVTTNFFNLTPGTTVTDNDTFKFRQETSVGLFPGIVINWNGPDLTGIQTFVSVANNDIHQDLNSSANQVPEPGTVLLFASGLLGLAGYRRHQRRRKGIQVG